jgi:hypothetical protein
MFEGVKAWFEGMGVGFQLARDGCAGDQNALQSRSMAMKWR